MSYLAMSAAPYDNNYENNENSGVQQKKLARNSTQNNSKSDLLIDNEKVNQVLQSIHNIHNNPSMPEEDEGDLADFNPPPPPVSAGVVRTMSKESTPTTNSSTPPKPSYSSSFQQPEGELNNYSKNYGNEESINEYYKKYVPNYSPTYSPTYSQSFSPFSHQESKEDVLLEKLNYMIHLLEEQKDERTHTVMEEVVLYSFLGIFIIYIVDSFTRIGKYTR